METNIQSALDAIKKSMAAGSIGDPRIPELVRSTFAQSASATSGLTFYDLEVGAKFLYPVLTPLRNIIPRVSGRGGIQAAWRAVTGVNTSNMRAGVSGGNRGGVIAVSTQDYTAAYKGIGLETNVDFEAQYAGQNFDDVRAIAGKVGLESLMLQEEPLLLGGNGSLALGTTPTPSVTAVTSGGSMADAAYSVICFALTLEGYIYGSVAGGIQGSITRTNADGSTDTFGGGAAGRSAAGTATISGGSNLGRLTATVTAVTGAFGYAWFWGASGSEVLGQITSINSANITATATGTQTAASLGSADNSRNTLVFDGIATQAMTSGSGATISTLATGTAGTGTVLTGDGYGGIVQVDAVLKTMWDTYKLSPSTMWVSSQEANNLSTKILAGATSAAQRFVFTAAQDAIGGGVMVRTYLNKFSLGGANIINIRIHPNMPPGTILFTTDTLPYPMSNVGNIFQVRTRQDYYQIEWPLRSRKYEYGVYADEVLQLYFPPAFALIRNIGNG